MKKIYQAVVAAEAAIAMTFLALMVGLIFVGAVSRAFGYPLNWTTDAATAFFAWACFLCADIAWRKNSLMAIEVLTSRLSETLAFALRMVNYALITAFLLYLISMGLYLSWISRARSFQGIPEISYSWVTLSLPVGALLLLITTALKLRDDLHGKPPDNKAVDIL